MFDTPSQRAAMRTQALSIDALTLTLSANIKYLCSFLIFIKSIKANNIIKRFLQLMIFQILNSLNIPQKEI